MITNVCYKDLLFMNKIWLTFLVICMFIVIIIKINHETNKPIDYNTHEMSKEVIKVTPKHNTNNTESNDSDDDDGIGIGIDITTGRIGIDTGLNPFMISF